MAQKGAWPGWGKAVHKGHLETVHQHCIDEHNQEELVEIDNFMMMMYTVIFTLLALLSYTTATTEWWGDLRAHLNPAKSPAFYDVTYDDSDCPQGLRSDAIPDFVYFGTMMATMTVDDHDECIQRCVDKPRCRAVNYFHPIAYQEKGFCELLSETQLDNPRLLRPFRKAVYYENIRCRDVEDVVDSNDHSLPVIPPTEAKRPQKTDMSTLMKKLSAKVRDFNNTPFRVARK